MSGLPADDGGAMGSEASGAPATGGSGAASMGPDGTASTGGASTMGAAFALRTGAFPRRVEVQAPRARAEHITAAVSQREFVINVLACRAVRSGRAFVQPRLRVRI